MSLVTTPSFIYIYIYFLIANSMQRPPDFVLSYSGWCKMNMIQVILNTETSTSVLEDLMKVKSHAPLRNKNTERMQIT